MIRKRQLLALGYTITEATWQFGMTSAALLLVLNH